MAGLTAVRQDIVYRTDNIGAVTGVTVVEHTRKLGMVLLLVRTVKISIVAAMTIDTVARADANLSVMANSRTDYSIVKRTANRRTVSKASICRRNVTQRTGIIMDIHDKISPAMAGGTDSISLKCRTMGVAPCSSMGGIAEGSVYQGMAAGTTDRVGAVKSRSGAAPQAAVGAASCIVMACITVVVMDEWSTNYVCCTMTGSTLRIGSSNVVVMVGIPGRCIMRVEVNVVVIRVSLVMTSRTAAWAALDMTCRTTKCSRTGRAATIRTVGK